MSYLKCKIFYLYSKIESENIEKYFHSMAQESVTLYNVDRIQTESDGN